MGIVAALLKSPEQLHRLRAAIRGRYPVSPCDGWETVRRLCDQEAVSLAVLDLYVDGSMDLDPVRQLRRLYPRLVTVAYVSVRPDRIRDVFDFGRAGLDGLIIADRDDAPTDLWAILEQAETRSVASNLRTALAIVRSDGSRRGARCGDAGSREPERRRSSTAAVDSTTVADEATHPRRLPRPASAPHLGTADRCGPDARRPQSERRRRLCRPQVSVGQRVQEHLPALRPRDADRAPPARRRRVRRESATGRDRAAAATHGRVDWIYSRPWARRRNSSRVFASSRNDPSSALVIVFEFCFSTPRIIMQRCIASITTPTPRGCEHLLDRFRDLSRQPLLHLKPAREHVDDPR